MNELIAYFVKMGMSPDVATQLATQVSRMAPPTPPVANGIKLSPDDAVVNLLTTKYGMDPHQAFAYAGRVLAGTATGGRQIQEEAMSHVADREVSRMRGWKRSADDINAKNSADLERTAQMETSRLHHLKAYADAAKVNPEDRTPEQTQAYNQVEDWHRKQMTAEADKQLGEDRANTAEYEAEGQAAEADRKASDKQSDDRYWHQIALNRKMGYK